jgi:hypothetical protein
MAIVFLRRAVDQVRRKYHNRPLILDGVWFSSHREARRWSELRMLARAGQISDLGRQVQFPLHAVGYDGGSYQVGAYVADFTYLLRPPPHIDGRSVLVVEDAKGVRTDLYRWKKKHFELEYAVKISEV